LAAASLAALSRGGAVALWFWLAGGAAAGLAVALDSRRRRPAPGDRPGIPGPRASSARAWLLASGVVLCAAALLVVAVVARSGTGEGDLVFRGHDNALDPIVYASYARRLAVHGLPFRNAFAADATAAGSTVPMAMLAGLNGLGVPVLDAAFRILPAFDVMGLGITALALLRMLGVSAPAATLAALLLLLGGEASAWLAPLAAALGLDARTPNPFLCFGPFLLAFNPIAPALQTWLAGLLLVLSAGKRGRVGALLAGAFVAALFEIKVFLWAPVLGGLVLVAFFAGPATGARRWRAAALAGVLLSLPLAGMRMLDAGGDETGLEFCLGCMPRWFWRASLGDHSVSTDLFETFRLAELLEPATLVAAVVGTLLMAGFGLGARLLLLPEWIRAARSGVEREALLARHVLASGALGFALACALGTTPHQTNAVQFAWAASFGGWLAAACALPRWWRTRRFATLAAFLLLLAPGSLRALGPLGFGAPARFAVSATERAFLEEVTRHVGPDDVVLEPSILRDMDVPSPLPWLANRPVYLSLLSAVQQLPEAERERRLEQLFAVFLERDDVRAREALLASEARFVLVPAGWPPLSAGARDLLEPLLTDEAGTLFRVRRP
jgi:hypothetical protein